MTAENTPFEVIDATVESQKEYFRSGATLDIAFRKKMLHKLLAAIKENEKVLADALWTDLHKCYEEAYLTEISLVEAEIRTHIRKVAKWARKERKPSPVTIFGSSSYIVKEPLGNSLIISPWNYPVLLLLDPLVGAISAGCTAILKPSPYVPTVSKAIEKLITDHFEPRYISVISGNRNVNTHLLSKKYDLIFFTGSPVLGKTVMEAASKNLTPVVLELGGKSPCIIDKTADIKLAAKRIAWGKTINSGQTCIAPDYILIHEDVKDSFVKEFGAAVEKLHGNDIKDSRCYVRMVSDKAFSRVVSYMEDGKILYGGRSDASQRFIEPTLLDNVAPDSPVMTEEIFGPVFPMMTFSEKNGRSFADQVAEFITERPKPLAFYYFGKEKDGWNLIGRTSSGGGCINDTIMHIANSKIPFGGVGNSGMGAYHDKESFEVFTHRRSIVSTPTLFDLPFRYMPYKLFKLIEKIV